MWVSVAYSCLEYSKTSHNICKEQLHYLSCSNFLATHPVRDENCVFYKAIYTSESHVASIRDSILMDMTYWGLS